MTDENNKITVSKRTNRDLMALAKNIRPLMKKILGPKGLVQVELLSRWSEIVGEDLAEYSFPDKIEFAGSQKSNGTIQLLVPNGAFALELQHREPQILARINAYFGYAAVSKLRILQNSQAQFAQKVKQSKKTVKPLVVSPEEESYIKEMGAEIKNPQLKEILIKLGYSVFSDNNQK